ncbi:MAG: substrate-binding domain-containing protein [Nitrososphaerota archaeon]|jgi:molybdate/tungstate transport system substrate-binding protein|nr:substrate-binding domain-containing protein [Nitrososphaerota archaeon]MDG6928141.1 substrate-binding domain-containing protein [Nitrososphaerota archaeon]MDG6930980.1 substrate-binding domain-containing protein [Nitrososphaerota archaeon]MDG6932804.1 substrate-binding domain-containing protein [Nitrososphaerota archaeon]MDG6935313.1 substrate-binding domain-containing protein [Nitrososphaerota archaeon]
MNRYEGIAVILLIVLFSGISYYEGNTQVSRPQFNTIAASLYAPFLKTAISDAGISGSVTAMGSVAAAQRVVLSPDQYSFFLSIDPAVIQDLLYPRNISSWYVAVAGDQMVIGVSPRYSATVSSLNQSLYQAEINNNTALEEKYLSELLSTILSGKATVGTSNPNTDPEGYRALMMLQLSGLMIYNNITHYTSELSYINSTGKLYEVTSGSALFAYLESGTVDFDIAIYRSAAIEQHIPYIILPSMINLGDSNYSSFYQRSSVTIVSDGQSVTLKGAPIYLCFTIPDSSSDATQGAVLALYIISPQGKLLMKSYGITPLEMPLIFGNVSSVPAPLSYYVNSTVLDLK